MVDVGTTTSITNRTSPEFTEIRTETSEKTDQPKEEFKRVQYEEDDSKSFEEEDKNRAKLLLFATSRTTTKFKLKVVLSTTPYTCVVASSTVACAGRRRRRSSSHLKLSVGLTDTNRNLEGSLDAQALKDSMDQESRTPRKFLTVWTTRFSTKTVTSYVTDRGVSVSVSAACTVAGGNGIPGCG
ncbi:hypothetical protein FHG87_024839 [Trinorchestia longiramus]|nr:hypothetical protein FHG87_024839 [Trinorchestia longiramus]